INFDRSKSAMEHGYGINWGAYARGLSVSNNRPSMMVCYDQDDSAGELRPIGLDDITFLLIVCAFMFLMSLSVHVGSRSVRKMFRKLLLSQLTILSLVLSAV